MPDNAPRRRPDPRPDDDEVPPPGAMAAALTGIISVRRQRAAEARQRDLAATAAAALRLRQARAPRVAPLPVEPDVDAARIQVERDELAAWLRRKDEEQCS